jgi:hypothetical protein
VLLVNDAQESAVLRDKKSVRRLQLRSVLCAPLIVSNEAFAVIYLENRELSARFNERHEQLLSEICVLAAPRLHPGSADHAAIALAASVCGAGDWFHSTRVPRSCDRVPWSLVTSNPQFVFRLLSPIENASLVGEGLARATTGSAVGARTSRSGIATRRTA